MSSEWLSLSEVASMLGVHPSTVRNWADRGSLPVHRTQGGHRRFRRSEIDLWLQSQKADSHHNTDQILQKAVRQVRLHISDGRLEEEVWYQKLELAAREQYRRTGRSMVLGLAAIMTADQHAMEGEARSLGYEYALLARRHGLSSVEAINAFLFFRNALLDAMLTVYESAAVGSSQAWGAMLRKINRFTDLIMVKLIEDYVTHERGNRNG